MTTPSLFHLKQTVYFILPHGMGSDVLQAAKKKGAFGGTIRLGEGTTASALLDLFCLNENKKEILTLFMDDKLIDTIVPQLIQQFKIEKKHRGIAYIIPNTQQKKGEKNMYQLITTIVDKGLAEEVIHAATKAGSKGGTIMNARGSSIYNMEKLFAMDIEPEKETVLIVASNETVEAIIQSIQASLQLDEQNSILFTQPITQAYGIYE